MMNEDDSKFTEDEEVKILENGEQAFALLTEWASSGARLVYSAGLGGLKVEGSISPFREREEGPWGVFDASFLFSAAVPGITAYILMEPRMKLVSRPGRSPRLELGNDGSSLHRIEEHKPAPETLERVMAQLKGWANSKMKVWVHSRLGFSALGAVCEIEAVNDQSFALFAGDPTQQTIFVYPALSSKVSIGQVSIGEEQTTCITLTSEDGRTELSIYEETSDRQEFMFRIASKMIH